MTNLRIVKIKLLTIILSSLIIVLFKNWTLVIGLFVVSLLLSIKGVRMDKLVKRIFPLILIVISVIFFQIIFNYSVDLSTRISLGLISGLKIFTISLMVFLFTSTTSPSEIASVFSFLPSRVQLLVTMTLSLIPLVFEEAHKIQLVQNSRGNAKRRISLFGGFLPVIIPLLHQTLIRSEQLAQTMESRGFYEKS